MHPDGDEQDCVDIDECELFDNVCVHGDCENQNGLFKCYCDEGFKLGIIMFPAEILKYQNIYPR